jgi:hypothetical protein
MPSADQPGGSPSAPPWAISGPRWAIPVLAASWLACLAGLLHIPLDLYDECLLLVGGREVRAGALPYRDFYTHYGPLGYELISWFLPLGNPGLAYRIAQGIVLLGLAVVLAGAVLAVRTAGAGVWTALAAAVAFLGLATAARAPHFFAYGFVIAGLGILAWPERAVPSTGRVGLDALAGASFALAALVRPAFGVYACAGAIGAMLATARGAGQAVRRTALLAAAAAVTALVAWLAFFRRIPLEDAWVATVVIPRQLSLGSSRFVAPALQLDVLRIGARAWIAAVALAATVALALLGALGSAERRARATAAAATALAATLPFVLASAASPGRRATAATAALLALALVAWAFARGWVASDGRRRLAAICGLTSVAFLHYYLSRADIAHLAPSLGLAIAAGLLVLPDLRVRGRVAAVLLIAAATRSPTLGVEQSPPFAIGRAAPAGYASTASGAWRRWPAASFPAEAVSAVRAADAAADPRSRFVAAASDHRSAEGSAVVLFLLSSRLPYTKWYAYDPGVQNSPFVQRLMVDELERSGSRSAVVWSALSFGGTERRPDEPAREPLDRRVLELYPVVAERFGGLAVRLR